MTLTLLFDLDDTLLDSNIESLVPVYFQKLTQHLAHLIPPAQIQTELMRSTQRMYLSARPDRTLEQVFSEDFYRAFGTTRETLAEAIDQFYDEVFPTLQNLTQPRPQAVDFVEWAQQRGYDMAIATDPLFPRKAILHRLRWANLPPEGYPFRLISDFETFHFAKASVAYYPEFLARLGLVDSPVLMIGDSLERDVFPASQAGIPVFWLRPQEQAQTPQAEQIPQGDLQALRDFLENTDPETLTPRWNLASALVAQLQATPAVMHTLSLQHAPAALSARPAQAEWSFGEVLCHLRDVDAEVNLPRVLAVLHAENPLVAGVDTDPWAEERQYLRQDAGQALAQFVEVRQKIVERLSSLSAEEWQRPARHTIFGPTTLQEMVGIMAAHDRLHLQQAAQALGRS